MIVALNSFVSRTVDKCRPFFQLLKKWKGFQCEECEEAFRDLKRYLVSSPILSNPKLGKDLYMYLAVSDHAMSVVLLKTQGRVQRPVYYISRTRVDLETHYLPLEKMALALVHATRKLPHYF